MKKAVYFMIMMGVSCHIIFSQPRDHFRPGVDNPYEKEQLTDAELAEQLHREEEQKLKQKNNYAGFKKIINIYENNYINFIRSNEQVDRALRIFSTGNNIEEELIMLVACAESNYNRIDEMTYNGSLILEKMRRITNQINTKKTQCLKNKSYLSKEEKNSIRLAVTILSLKDRLEDKVSYRATCLNPGVQETMTTLFSEGLIKDGQEIKELQLVLYFYLKEISGELAARLKQI